jgi:hypothetical protein
VSLSAFPLTRFYKTTPLSVLRQKLIRHIWGTPRLPTTLPAITNQGNIGYKTVGLGDVATTYELTCTLPRGGSAVLHWLVPTAPALGIAVIGSGGHGMNYFSGADPVHDVNAQNVLTDLMGAGFHYLGICMPTLGYNPSSLTLAKAAGGSVTIGRNTCYGALDQHDFSAIDGDGGLSALVWFLEHVVQGINWIKAGCPGCAPAIPAITRICLHGISGGGWTTDLVSAIDPRVDRCCNVYGSLPFSMRAAHGGPGDAGDWEQGETRKWYPVIGGLYAFENLYKLGCLEKGRRRLHVIGMADTLFPAATIRQPLRDLEASTRAAVNGQHEIWIDKDIRSFGNHCYSTAAIAKMHDYFLAA